MKRLYIEREEQKGKLMLPDFKTYYEGIVVKATWYQHKNRQIDQCNRTESRKKICFYIGMSVVPAPFVKRPSLLNCISLDSLSKVKKKKNESRNRPYAPHKN